MNTWITAILIGLGITLFISAIVYGAFYFIDGLMRGEKWATYIYWIIVAIFALLMFGCLVIAIHSILL